MRRGLRTVSGSLTEYRVQMVASSEEPVAIVLEVRASSHESTHLHTDARDATTYAKRLAAAGV